MKLREALLLTIVTAPLAAQSAASVDFAKQVFPILEKNCIECHRATYVDKNGRRQRPKGRVMLDTLANIRKSKRGKLFVAEQPDESLVMETIDLPADDEDRMPPPKKGPPLSKYQVNLIKRWIEQGADYGTWTGEETQPARGGKSAKPAAKTRSDSKPQSVPKKTGPSPVVILSKGLSPVSAAQLAPFRAPDALFSVKSIGDDSPLLRVSCCGKSDDVDDAALAQLLPIADHIFDLDLARSQVSDGGCAVIAKMRRLTKLDLRQSQVANAGVKQLASCKELRSLNLFDTRVGDYAMIAVADLQHLEQLYVWKTDVSAKAVVRLRDRRKGMRVVFMPDMPAPMDEEETGRRRRR